MVLPRPSSSQGSNPPATANIDVVARELTPDSSATSSFAPGASQPPPGIPSTSIISTNSTAQPTGQGIEAITAPASSTSRESHPKSFALDDLDDLDFKYPEIGLDDLNILPPLPSEWARPVLPTFSQDQVSIPCTQFDLVLFLMYFAPSPSCRITQDNKNQLSWTLMRPSSTPPPCLMTVSVLSNTAMSKRPSTARAPLLPRIVIRRPSHKPLGAWSPYYSACSWNLRRIDGIC